MKTKLILLIVASVTLIFSAWYFFGDQPLPVENVTPQEPFTNVMITNSSDQDSVMVYVTLPSTDSVMGLFGITDTISWCKGFFYALKDSSYSSNVSTPLNGVVVSFGGDNLPCQVAVPQGYLFGINIFEFSINVSSECFDISCEDGVNAILKSSVSDTINWATGEGDYVANFRSAQNTFPLLNNIGIRGVYPYRCTDCKDLGKAVPENCFNLKDTCNTQRICQVARTNNIGGTIYIDYVSPALVPAK
jgi:hypothetical protein